MFTTRCILTFLRPSTQDMWEPLDQIWNTILQANFESYIEIRPVSLEELRTRIAAEIACSTGMHGNPFWWDSWETDQNFHFENFNQSTPPKNNSSGVAMSASSPFPIINMTTSGNSYVEQLLAGTSPDGSLLSVSSSTNSLTRLTKENLERLDKGVFRTQSNQSNPSNKHTPPRLRQFYSHQSPIQSQPAPPKVYLSLTCQRRQKYVELVERRDQPTEASFDDHVGAMFVFLSWDNDIEKSEMDWEKTCPFNDSKYHMDEEEETSEIKQARHIVNLHMEPSATEAAVNSHWNWQTEFAYGFAKKDIRAHAIEGMLLCCNAISSDWPADFEFDQGSDLPRVVEYFWFVANVH